MAQGPPGPEPTRQTDSRAHVRATVPPPPCCRQTTPSDRPIVPPTIFPTSPVGSHVALVLIHCTTVSTKQTLFLPLLCPCASCCLGHEPHSSPPTPTSELAKCTALSVPHRTSAAKSSLPEPPRAPPHAPPPSTTDCPCCCLHELHSDV
jgi:hypothetical protein